MIGYAHRSKVSPHRRQFERRQIARFLAAGLPFAGLLTVARFMRISRNTPDLTLPALANIRENERAALNSLLAHWQGAFAREMAAASVVDNDAPAQTRIFASGNLAENLSVLPAPSSASSDAPGVFMHLPPAERTIS